jgi:hypothetical protein
MGVGVTRAWVFIASFTSEHRVVWIAWRSVAAILATMPIVTAEQPLTRV